MKLNNIKISRDSLDVDYSEELERILDRLPLEITGESENIEIEAHYSGGKHLHLNCPEGQTYRIKVGKDIFVGSSSQYSTSLFDMREKFQNVYSCWIHIMTGGYKQPPTMFPVISPL